jgi:hypothetical protein
VTRGGRFVASFRDLEALLRTTRWWWTLALAACAGPSGDDTVDSDVGIDCRYVAPGDADWCTCEPTHVYCDGTCDPTSTDPFDYVEDGGECDCQAYLDAGVVDMPSACVPVYFEPFQLWVYGDFGYDSAADQIRSYFVDGKEVDPAIVVLIYSEAFAASGLADDVCRLKLVPHDATLPATATTFSADLGGGRHSYRHVGMRLAAGAFDAVDDPIGSGPSYVAGCSTKHFDPARWGTDFYALFEGQTWGEFVGPMAPEIRSAVEALDDDPDDDWDYPSLLANGYLYGGSWSASANLGTTPVQVTRGYRVDPTSFDVLPSDDPEGPAYQELTTAEMLPDETAGLLGTGVYQAEPGFYWEASYVLVP